jgi:diazepam-binding inhibitor (GABA receptor modulator, acyl-CoA-binding protein)
MADLNAQFEAAAEAVKALPERPDNEMLLRLYALYKQGSEGDVKGDKPGFFDFKGVAKYDAWEKLKGTDATKAKEDYVKLVKRLGGKV